MSANLHCCILIGKVNAVVSQNYRIKYAMFCFQERNPSPNSSLSSTDRQTLRWRKDTAVWRSTNEAGENKPRVDVELDAYIEGNLSTQTSLTILDTLELIVQVSFVLKFASIQ